MDYWVSCSHDKSIQCWDLTQGTCIKTITVKKEIYCLLLLPNDMLASGSRANTVQIWDINNKKYTKRSHGICF